jgi:hypothetical protein
MKGSQESLTTAVVKDAANWPTPNAQVSQDGESPETWLKRKEAMKAKGYNGNGCGTPLTIAVQLHGQAAPASSSSLGSRQGLSWPTPQTMDTLPVRPVEEFAETNKTRGGRKNRKALSNLREAVHSPVYQASWATPAAFDWNVPETQAAWARRAATQKSKGVNLHLPLKSQAVHEAEKQWGTPTARDHKSGRGNEERQYKELTPMVERQQSGKLNPRWVETLMGLPIGWTMPSCTSPQTIALTSCDSSAMELCLPPQSELSEFSLAS